MRTLGTHDSRLNAAPGTATALTSVNERLKSEGLGILGIFASSSAPASIWIVAQNETGDVALKVAPDGSSAESSKPFPSDATISANLPGAVDKSGDLWLGTGTGLLHVDKGSLDVTKYSFPNVDAPTGSSAATPPEQRGGQWSNGLALDAGGDVYVALANATALIRFDSARKAFTTISLPSSSEDARGIAILDDGTIGVTMRDEGTGELNSIAVNRKGTWEKFTVPAAAFIVSDHTTFITGALHLFSVSADGRAVTSLGDSTILAQAPVVLADGSVVGITSTGVRGFDLGGKVRDTDAPLEACPPGLNPPPNAETVTTTFQPEMCRDSFNMIATDGTTTYIGSLFGRVYSVE